MAITENDQIKQMRFLILDNGNDSSQDELFELLLTRAKYTYLRLVYPFEREVEELPDDRAKDWQTRCAIELYNLGEKGNLTRYSENGLSEGYGKAGLSVDLLSELPPARGKVVY